MATKKARKNVAEQQSRIDLKDLAVEEPEDGIFDAYSNMINLNWTPFDLTLRFGQIIQVPDPQSPTWENQHGLLLERAAITVPWQVARVLRNLLDDVLKTAEVQGGEPQPVVGTSGEQLNPGVNAIAERPRRAFRLDDD